MSAKDILPFACLAGGLYAISKAMQRPKRKLQERDGEPCTSGEAEPYGYDCVNRDGQWSLEKETPSYLGFGGYGNQEAVNSALVRLGFDAGDLKGFQIYVSENSSWNLRKDGKIDRDTILALESSEKLLQRGEWEFPE